MTKEDKIKEAYGEYYVKDNIDENGWTNSPSQGFINSIPCDAKEMHIVYGKPEWWYRPKLLSGIENNNGWIKIESEKDLPEEHILCFIVINGNVGIASYRNTFGNKEFWTHETGIEISKVSHYQILVKPKPPIY